MSNEDKDLFLVEDRSGRRQFIRRGAAFVAVGSGLAASNTAYADDCDRNAGQEKNAQAPGSDSDQGEGSDPTGCGRQPPKISSRPNTANPEQAVKVKKITT